MKHPLPTTLTALLLTFSAAAISLSAPALTEYFEAEGMTIGKGFRTMKSPYGYSGNGFLLKYGHQTDFKEFWGRHELEGYLSPGTYSVVASGFALREKVTTKMQSAASTMVPMTSPVIPSNA